MPKIRLRADSKTDSVKVTDGPYSRSFERSKQPFEVTKKELRILMRTGEFEQVSETEAKKKETTPAEKDTNTLTKK